MTHSEFTPVIELLARVPRPPGDRPHVGASNEQLMALGRDLGYPVPGSLTSWLGVCNGLIAGPGGLYGASPGEEFLDINFILGLHPGWRDRKWIPVAGDGNGNHYVIDASHAHLDSDAVFFVDTSANDLALAYAVASDLHTFLAFLLDRELGTRGWPFDTDYVLSKDSQIASVRPQSLLPWNA